MARDRKRPHWRRFPVATPAAGAEFTLRNDRGSQWWIRALTWRLVTSAVVGNRVTGLSVTAGEDVWFRTGSGATQTASQTIDYQVFPGSALPAPIGVIQLLPWPTDGLWVPAGHTLASVTENIDAGDQYSRILVDLVEYPETMPVNLVPSITLYEDSESE